MSSRWLRILMVLGLALAVTVSVPAVSFAGSHSAKSHTAKKKKQKKKIKVLRGPRGFTGATGATGATGPTGATGATGSARAYGLVSATGVANPARTFNATVRRVNLGRYCITPGPGINPATVAPQATIDFSTSNNNDALAQFRSANTICTATEFEIDTLTASTKILSDQGFTFLVP